MDRTECRCAYRLEAGGNICVSHSDLPKGTRQQRKDNGETQLHHSKRNMYFQCTQETHERKYSHEHEQKCWWRIVSNNAGPFPLLPKIGVQGIPPPRRIVQNK